MAAPDVEELRLPPISASPRAAASPRPTASPRRMEVADKVGAGGDRVCLKKLVVWPAEKSPLDHFDVHAKSDFGPKSPGMHTAPRFGPGFNSNKLSATQENEIRRQRALELSVKLGDAAAERKRWKPPPHMGLGRVPSRVAIDADAELMAQSRESGALGPLTARPSVVRKIETHSANSQQLPLSARPSVNDYLSGRASVAPLANLSSDKPGKFGLVAQPTGRTVKPTPPAAGFSFPRPEPELLKAARDASAAVSLPSAHPADSPPAPCIRLNTPNGGDAAETQLAAIVTSGGSNAPRGSGPPPPPSTAAPQDAGNRRGPVISPPTAAVATSVAAGGAGQKEPTSPSRAPTASEILQSLLPPLFPAHAQQRRKRGPLKATVRDADGSVRPTEHPIAHRRRSSVAGNAPLAPIAVSAAHSRQGTPSPSQASARSARTMTNSSGPQLSSNPAPAVAPVPQPPQQSASQSPRSLQQTARRLSAVGLQ